jgi:DNA helicase-2/ATP-dependent DNA helicase PcrA
VFIDEFQDLAGWDLEVIRCLLQSGIRVTLVGDPRQHTYSTNPSSKNKSKSKANIVDDSDFVKQAKKWQEAGLCMLETMSGTHRCNGAICEFVNVLWPGMDPMKPLRNDTTDHDGVFLVAECAVDEYIQRYRPQVLRYNKTANTYGYEALNFGLAKGLEFSRVLIVPTEPIRKYLKSGALSHVEASRDKLHVAVTRARHSVAFVYDGQSPVVPVRFSPSLRS